MLKKYLALGDSYTVGEQVVKTDSFPFQLVRQLRKKKLQFTEPDVIAQTGWTTGELKAAIEARPPGTSYDLVSLLIGVNNQYRGRTITEYTMEFEELLNLSIAFAAGLAERVVVLSIPDWGVTPFAAERNRVRIAAEIDAFNAINRRLAEKAGVLYVDITDSTREATAIPGLLAADGLHPSGLEYAKWATRIAGLWPSSRRMINGNPVYTS